MLGTGTACAISLLGEFPSVPNTALPQVKGTFPHTGMQLTATSASTAPLDGESWDTPTKSMAAHLVYILFLILEVGELPPVQAVGHFVGADKLLLPHTACTLSDDPAQPHLPQQVGLWRGEEDEWGALRMGCTALEPTRTTKWEGGHWDKERVLEIPCGGNPPALHPKVGRANEIINPCPTFLQWTCLLQAHPKMPLGGSLMQQFSPMLATRSSEIL